MASAQSSNLRHAYALVPARQRARFPSCEVTQKASHGRHLGKAVNWYMKGSEAQSWLGAIALAMHGRSRAPMGFPSVSRVYAVLEVGTREGTAIGKEISHGIARRLFGGNSYTHIAQGLLARLIIIPSD